MKHILDPAVFLVDSGLLFEINRRVLHPHGIALVVDYPTTPVERAQTKETTHTSVSLWDSRKDQEGIIFTEETFEEGKTKLAKTLEAAQERFKTRRSAHGYVLQGGAAYDAYGTESETTKSTPA